MLVNRNILTRNDAQVGNKKIRTPESAAAYDNYYSRLIKLIPAELIALYLALDGIVSAMPQKQILLWVVFGIALVGGWFYLARVANVTRVAQRIITLMAFVIWVFVLGGPFAMLPWYDVNYGKLLVTLYTFFVPLFYK